MSKTITNLTLPVVTEVVETVLELYPDHPYQQAFASPDLRDKLIAHILSRIPNQYTAIDNDDDDSMPSQLSSSTYGSELKLQIESIVYDGIQHVFTANAEWISHHVPESVTAGTDPSHWFG
ncbi:hypothetical protein DO97_08880 [Neosynechococcus sphagnicola sy1]|uniref:Competence protein ComFB n=1 Tax=Neosynechococcus sphagnicola sy1 TaxID=1497020 RepID=A0A098TIT2_9CYAN|nr:hypothetical protein [Neosynechococcus sphagnicola]KGF72465.1 hypothetical protein DO97_08880 [Neosynechococcus sphagnicola sy1]